MLSPKHQTQLLNLGLKHILPSSLPSTHTILKEYAHLSRCLRLKHFFKDKDNTLPLNPFKLPNPNWKPPNNYTPLEHILNKHHINLHNSLKSIKIKPTKLPPHFSIALKTLRNNKNIIILSIDKNVGVCVFDKNTYYQKSLYHMSDKTTYKVVPTYPLKELVYKLHNIVRKYT